MVEREIVGVKAGRECQWWFKNGVKDGGRSLLTGKILFSHLGVQ
jgi:hypothetical protein